MGWNDSSETIIAGTGQVAVASVGTTLPANATASLDAAFSGLGFHTEDGVSTNQSPDIQEFKAWQSKYVIRRIRDSEEFQLSFALLQWNEINVPLAFGGGAVSALGGGQFKYTPPSPGDAIDERAIVCDVIDGSRHGRFVIPRATATEGVESKFTRSDMGELPITIKALEPLDSGPAWYFLTDDAAAFAAGS